MVRVVPRLSYTRIHHPLLPEADLSSFLRVPLPPRLRHTNILHGQKYFMHQHKILDALAESI